MNKKQAFTLAELLVVMAITGVIITIGYNTFKTFDKGIKYLYSSTYHSLDRAFYNAANYTSLKDPFAKASAPDEQEGTDSLATAGDGEGALDNMRATRLCKMLTEYIDTKSKSCGSGVTATPNGPSGGPSFVAVNGVAYYISKIFPSEPTSSDDHRFFLVFADLNGVDKTPNYMEYHPEDTSEYYKDPDIFAFAALDISRMCPLGPPEVDMKFMSSRISYHDFSSEEGSNEVLVKFSTVSKPYYISKAEAWGYYLDGKTSGDYPANDTIIKADDNPYMYNGYVKHVLETADDGAWANNNIYKFLTYTFAQEKKTYSFPRANIGADGKANNIHLMEGEINKASPLRGEYKCVAGSDEECDIIIEKYVW